MKYLYKLFAILFVIVGMSACSDYLTPSTQQNKEAGESIKTVGDLYSLMDGTYNRLTYVNYYGRNWIVNGEVRTDNAFSNGNSGRFITASKLAYTVTSATGLWQNAYQIISNTNLTINSNVPESPEANYVKGQALVVRAFVHMQLLIRYGQAYVDGSDKGIPYITTYNEGNLFPSRGSVQDTWDKIGTDFEKGLSLMSPEFDGSNTLLTYYGALALQSRYYLAVGEFNKASASAKEVIDNGDYQIASADNYIESWATDGSNNSIFELAFSTSDRHSFNNLARIYQNTSYGDIEVTKELYDLYKSGDVRLDLYNIYDNDNKVYRMVGKYPKTDGVDNIRVIRYAEVVLTYAEAQAELSNNSEAKKYLDKITSNRNVPNYAVASLNNIHLERRKELAMEGLRFFDLMRTGQGVKRDVPVRNQHDIAIPFGDYRLAYPIPQSELDANSSLKQNEGY